MWGRGNTANNSFNSGGRSNPGQGPRGSGRGSFRGRGRYSGGGRSGGRDGGQTTATETGETPLYNICQFYVRDGNCRFGDTCRNSHAIVTMMGLNAHQSPIKCLGHIVDSTGDGPPRILTGSTDSSIKV